MSRRSGGNPEEALDLFLDTICNTFGGVVFIAILVSVLLQLSGPAVPPAEDAPDDGRAARLAALRDEIEQLRRLKESLEEQMKALSPTGQEVLRQYRELREKEQQELARKDALAADALALDEELDGLLRKLEEVESRKAALALELDEAETELERASRGQLRVRLPMSKEATQNEQVGALLSGGRLCFYMLYDASARPSGENSADVATVDTVREGVPIRGLRPRPGRGVAVDGSDASRAELKRIFGKFDKKRQYFMIAVWPDSFAEFQQVRDVLLELGCDYGLAAIKQGEVIPLSLGGRGRTQ